MDGRIRYNAQYRGTIATKETRKAFHVENGSHGGEDASTVKLASLLVFVESCIDEKSIYNARDIIYIYIYNDACRVYDQCMEYNPFI